MWYCNHKYKSLKCPSPILKQTQIEEAFLKVLGKLGKEPVYSDELWKGLVDHAMVYSNPDRLVFSLKGGDKVEIYLH